MQAEENSCPKVQCFGNCLATAGMTGKRVRAFYILRIRYKPSDNYFGRVQINGKLIRRSLARVECRQIQAL